jgi:hypothetical protein
MASEEAALTALDAALRQKPKKDGCDFSEATEHLVALRRRLTERLRGGEDVTTPLGRVNGILSTVVGAHFPLGEVHWPSVERARDALAELLTEERGLRG